MLNEKKRWCLRHPDFENLAWGQPDDILNGTDLVGWVDPIVGGKIQIIESKYKPTYLNFIGSNSHTKEMKKGVVYEL